MIIAGIYESPIGFLELKLKKGKLIELDFLKERRFNRPDVKVMAEFTDVSEWLDLYFKGQKKEMFMNIELEGTHFQKIVWQILREIPYGTWVTYSDIAKMIEQKTGRRMSAQAVGAAVGKNPIAIILPCHRVLGKNMKLTGFRGGLETKIKLLELEGISGWQY